jgi:hypothetical protein
VAAAAADRLEERVQRVVEQAVAAHRGELEQLVRHRVDFALAELAAELVHQELHPNGTHDGAAVETPPAAASSASERPCSRCGQRPRLRWRSLCRDCYRADRRAADARHRAQRRPAAALADDDEEPHPARDANGSRRRPGGRVRAAEKHPEPPAGVGGEPGPGRVVAADPALNGSAAIAAADLAARARRGPQILDVTAAELEAWLVAEGLAVRTPAGLVPTSRGLALGGALEA